MSSLVHPIALKKRVIDRRTRLSDSTRLDLQVSFSWKFWICVRKGAGTRFGATREIFFGFCMYRLEEESDLVFDISLEVF